MRTYDIDYDEKAGTWTRVEAGQDGEFIMADEAFETIEGLRKDRHAAMEEAVKLRIRLATLRVGLRNIFNASGDNEL